VLQPVWGKRRTGRLSLFPSLFIGQFRKINNNRSLMFQPIKMTGLVNSLAVIAITLIACANKRVDTYRQKNRAPTESIEEGGVLKEHTKELMSVPGVVGTAQGLYSGKPCIKLHVLKKTPELHQKVPHILEGYPVIIEETGEIRALPKN
jgi:hypothetical protein